MSTDYLSVDLKTGIGFNTLLGFDFDSKVKVVGFLNVKEV